CDGVFVPRQKTSVLPLDGCRERFFCVGIESPGRVWRRVTPGWHDHARVNLERPVQAIPIDVDKGTPEIPVLPVEVVVDVQGAALEPSASIVPISYERHVRIQLAEPRVTDAFPTPVLVPLCREFPIPPNALEEPEVWVEALADFDVLDVIAPQAGVVV